MQETILAYFQGIDDEAPQWSLVDDSEAPVIKTSLDELRFKTNQHRVCVVIPAAGFSCFEINIKTKNNKKLLQAAKYLLEDRILDATDDVFFTIDKRNSSDIRVWLCKTELIQSWINHLANLGLEVERIIPDVLLMEPENSTHELWLMEGKAVLHDGLNFAFLDSSNIDILLDSIVVQADSEQDLPICETYVFADDLLAHIENREDIDFRFNNYLVNSSPLEILHERVDRNRDFNLLQGKYSKPSYIMEKLRPWRLTAVLLLTLGVLHIFSLLYDLHYLQQRADYLHNQMQQVYVNTFPSELKPDKPYEQIQEKVKNLKQVNNKTRNYISQILSDMSGFVSKDITVNNVLFTDYGSRIKVKIEADNISLIESIVNKVDKDRYLAKVLSASERKTGSEGLLEIEIK